MEQELDPEGTIPLPDQPQIRRILDCLDEETGINELKPSRYAKLLDTYRWHDDLDMYLLEKYGQNGLTRAVREYMGLQAHAATKPHPPRFKKGSWDTHEPFTIKDFHDIVDAYEADLKETALTDPLVEGFYRTNVMEAALQQAITEAHNKRRIDTIVAADLNRFKMINDTYGHLIGDKVLRCLGWTFRFNTKLTDLLGLVEEDATQEDQDQTQAIDNISLGLWGRTGGDEFVIYLRHCTKEDALKVVKRLQKRFTQNLKELVPEVQSQITISFGIRQVQRYHDIQSLRRDVDIALYHAKANKSHVSTNARLSKLVINI